MDIVLYLVAFIVVVIWLWMSVLATIAVTHDSTLEPFQKKAQTIIVWLIPYFGSAFVLHLAWQHYPRAIPKSWVPWPFKKAVYGKNPKPNRYRDDNEIDYFYTDGHSNSLNDYGEGSDIGGGGGD